MLSLIFHVLLEEPSELGRHLDPPPPRHEVELAGHLHLFLQFQLLHSGDGVLPRSTLVDALGEAERLQRSLMIAEVVNYAVQTPGAARLRVLHGKLGDDLRVSRRLYIENMAILCLEVTVGDQS